MTKMEAGENKKMPFSIDVLSKSSRTESVSEEECGIYFTNSGVWQDEHVLNKSPIPTTNIYSNNGQTSPFGGTFYSPSGNDEHRLSPDSGYVSQNNTPNISGSCHKRKRISYEDVQTPVSSIHTNSFVDTSFDSSPDSDEGISDTPRPKKARTAFSNDQIEALEVKYRSQRYLPTAERSKLASKLKLTDQQVKTWFQNRRMKEKRQQKNESLSGGICLPTGGVDVAQLQALGIPCPPPYKINTTHHEMTRDEGFPSSPVTTYSSEGRPLFPIPQHVPLTPGFHPIRHALGSSPTNQMPTYT